MADNKKQKNYCKGCASLRLDSGDYCDFMVHNTVAEGLCPCVNCIIKSMCQCECDEFAKWTFGDMDDI